MRAILGVLGDVLGDPWRSLALSLALSLARDPWRRFPKTTPAQASCRASAVLADAVRPQPAGDPPPGGAEVGPGDGSARGATAGGVCGRALTTSMGLIGLAGAWRASSC